MAWRITESVERGEIDNRTSDRVTGKLWIYGMENPVELELTGNPHRDLAGQYLRFVNPTPKPLPEHYQDFAEEQTGCVGDITAARKVKILDIEDGELEHYYKNKIPMPYHWGNCLYLEWHSARNGRVVIEATDYQLTVEPEATWQMSEEEDGWPPEKLFAGDALVRLKKARDYLRDAWAALEAIEQDQLLEPEWIADLKKELRFIQHETRGYINEARNVLKNDDGLPF